MITVSHYRRNNIPKSEWDHPVYGALLVEREQSTYSALDTMIYSELGFGGEIIEVSETRMVTETEIFSCIDTVVFEGSAEEMLPLLQTGYFYEQAGQGSVKDEVLNMTVENWEKLPDNVKGKPIFVTTLGVWALARNRLKAAVLLALGITDEEDLKTGLELPIQDLATTMEIMQTYPEMTGKTLKQVVAELYS